MSRLKARLAKTPEDRDLQTHLSNAGRSLSNALKICQVVISKSEYGSQEKHKARHYAGVLQQASVLLSGVGYLTPNIDMSDPDLQLESTKKAPPRIQPPTPPPVMDEMEDEVL